jgi:hypothetical protein
MRAKFGQQGMPYDQAQTKAAKIYNATKKPQEPKLSNQPDQAKSPPRKAPPQSKLQSLQQGYTKLGSAKQKR